MKLRSPITSHILDTSKGLPAKNILVKLEMVKKNKLLFISQEKSNHEGRIENFMPLGTKATPGIYKMSFMVKNYFKKKSFYPEIVIFFEIKNNNQHYHIPLLLTPCGFTTYRGT